MSISNSWLVLNFIGIFLLIGWFLSCCAGVKSCCERTAERSNTRLEIRFGLVCGLCWYQKVITRIFIIETLFQRRFFEVAITRQNLKKCGKGSYFQKLRVFKFSFSPHGTVIGKKTELFWTWW
jgi:hypothetical protein